MSSGAASAKFRCYAVPKYSLNYFNSLLFCVPAAPYLNDYRPSAITRAKQDYHDQANWPNRHGQHFGALNATGYEKIGEPDANV